MQSIVLVAKRDAASKAALQEALQIHQRVISLPGFEATCLRHYAGAPCAYKTIFGIWNYSASALAAANLTHDMAVRPLIDLHGGGRLESDTVMDGTAPVRALQFLYYSEIGSESEAWEKRFIESLHGEKSRGLVHFTLMYGAQRSYKDESDRAIAQDNPLVHPNPNPNSTAAL